MVVNAAETQTCFHLMSACLITVLWTFLKFQPLKEEMVEEKEKEKGSGWKREEEEEAARKQK